MTQVSLLGEVVEHDRRPLPRTVVTDRETGDRVPRARARAQGDIGPGGQFIEPAQDAEEEDEEDPEKVGEMFDVTLDVTLTYRFSVPAWSEHQAKELAKEWQLDAKPSDSMVAHTRVDDLGTEVFEDDPHVPDDFDIYGGDRLGDVWIDDPDVDKGGGDEGDGDDGPDRLPVPWEVGDRA